MDIRSTWDDHFFKGRPFSASIFLRYRGPVEAVNEESRTMQRWLKPKGCSWKPWLSSVAFNWLPWNAAAGRYGQAGEKVALKKKKAALKGYSLSSGCTDVRMDFWWFFFDLFTSLGIWEPSLWLIKCQHQIQGIENLRNDRSSWLNHWQSFLLHPSCAPGFWICLNHRRRVAQAVSIVIKSVIMDTIFCRGPALLRSSLLLSNCKWNIEIHRNINFLQKCWMIPTSQTSSDIANIAHTYLGTNWG